MFWEIILMYMETGVWLRYFNSFCQPFTLKTINPNQAIMDLREVWSMNYYCHFNSTPIHMTNEAKMDENFENVYKEIAEYLST